MACFCGSTTLIHALQIWVQVPARSALNLSVYHAASVCGVKVCVACVGDERGFAAESRWGEGYDDSAGEVVVEFVTESIESERVTRVGADEDDVPVDAG